MHSMLYSSSISRYVNEAEVSGSHNIKERFTIQIYMCIMCMRACAAASQMKYTYTYFSFLILRCWNEKIKAELFHSIKNNN